MLKDAQDLAVTTHSNQTIAAINRFTEQSLIYGRDAEAAVLQAVAADPTCAIAQAYAAAYYLSQEHAAARQQASPFLQAAQRLHVETDRERLYIQAIGAWFKGAIGQAIAIHEELAQRFPRDLLSVQQGQYHYFYQGDNVGLLKLALAVLPHYSDHPYLLGMVAFGLEQCHRWQEAEQVGRRATALNRCNPWAHHAVAHVLEMQGRAAEGIAWMEALSPTWDDCNSMLYTHNWWHVALFYLAEANWLQTLSIYDRHLWGRAQKHAPKDQVGAISLLLRLKLKGVGVGDRWQQLLPHLLPRLHEHALPFQDLHFIYALAQTEQVALAHEMLVSMYAHAQTLESSSRRTWVEVAIPAAQGMIAHATGHWQGRSSTFAPFCRNSGPLAAAMPSGGCLNRSI